MAYASPSQLIQFCDVRLIGDLCEDTGVRQTPTQILTDPNVANALSTGAGIINSAALVGQRYTVAELAALTGDDQAFLVLLNSWLAFGLLCSRRGRDPKEHPEFVLASETLERLRLGDALFNVAANVEAGVPTTGFPTAAQYQQVNTLRSATQYYFPTRRTQQPAS